MGLEKGKAMFNLFDVTNGFDQAGRSGRHAEKPRAANDREVKAYAEWLRKRAKLADMGAPNLHWRTIGKGVKAHRYCVGASYSQGEHGFSVIFPGAAMVAKARVTMETLDDSGEVIAAQTLPIEPKKGGVIWSRQDVRKAAGKIDKRNPAPVADPAPIEEMDTAQPIEAIEPPAEIAPEPAQDVETAPAPSETAPEPETAPSEAEKPAPVAAGIEPDPAADILARVEAIEVQLATLSAEREALADHSRDTSALVAHEIARDDTQSPIEAIERPRRTAAHERAIRRAWAERRARRMAQGDIAAERFRANEAVQEARKFETWHRAISEDAAHLCRERDALAWKRRESLQRARRMIAAARSERDGARTLATSAETCTRAAERREAATRREIDRLKRDIADPSQPERASDVAMLMQRAERAETALAASQARAERLQAGLDKASEAIEGLAVRVARAEAAARKAAA